MEIIAAEFKVKVAGRVEIAQAVANLQFLQTINTERRLIR